MYENSFLFGHLAVPVNSFFFRQQRCFYIYFDLIFQPQFKGKPAYSTVTTSDIKPIR